MASFYIVDDDPLALKLQAALLQDAGHEVRCSTSSAKALSDIPLKRPECVIVDLMMPEIDGFGLCRSLRADPALRACKIVVVSAKSYDFDRRRARDVGANSFIVKPIDPDTFVAQIEKVMADAILATFWGVRGTLPVPGRRTLRYGGNTSCMTLEFENDLLLVFDAGSGIKELSNHLMASGRRTVTAKIFISHPHWDHINALPFFAPLYVPGNELEVCGPANGEFGMRELVGAQMDGVFFPITMREFGARVEFRNLAEETIDVQGIEIRAMLLNHPGNCLGYRINYRDRSICYVTDNELFPPEMPQHNERYLEQLIEFVRGADMLVTDATYTDLEYASKAGWGHSGIGQVVDLAHRAEVGTLYLFHHDPEQTDDDIDAKLEQARAQLTERGSKTRCVAPAERETVRL